MDQMTIFEVVSIENTDFRTLTIEDIVRIIENATGLVFKWDIVINEYKAIAKNKEYTVHLSKYTDSNEPFISCGYWDKKQLGGCGFPCDSLIDAVQFFRDRI